MFKAIMNSTVASFRLGDEKISLVPAEMIKSANLYSQKVGELLVTLRFEPVAEGMYRWVVTLKNQGVNPTAQITEFYGMDLEFPLVGEATWESIYGDNCGAAAFMPRKKPMPEDFSMTEEAVEGRSTQGEPFPYFDITCGEDTAIFAIGWTGQWKYTLTRTGEVAHLTAGFTDCDMYLNQGESIRSVGALIYSGKGLLKTRQDFRRIFRERLSPAAKTGGKLEVPVSIQVFDRYFWNTPDWRTEAGQIRCIDYSDRCGNINTYWLDAAWFRDGFPNGVGNYEFHPGLPNGLRPVSDRAHKSGYKFMLWFEPERNCKGSDTVTYHRDYLLTNGDPNTFLFNLADDEARTWLIDTIIRMIRDNGVDVYRQDFNMNPLSYWRAHDTANRKGYTENKYVTGLYLFWDALLAEFPGLIIDNCASGGRRLDFEMNTRSMPLWRSDTNCFPARENVPVHNWHQNQTIGLSRYLPYHAGATWETSAFTLRSGATMGLACNWPVMSDDFDPTTAQKPLAELTEIRDCWDGDFYPLTEATYDYENWCAYQLALEDKGFCVFFRREKSEEAEKTFQINALDPAKQYEVKLSNEAYEVETMVVSGAELATFTAKIPEQFASLLLIYKAL